jgi:long-subunit acyl-CoA synthetase (AMP-forming)
MEGCLLSKDTKYLSGEQKIVLEEGGASGRKKKEEEEEEGKGGVNEDSGNDDGDGNKNASFDLGSILDTIMYTSSSTGPQRGAMLSNSNMLFAGVICLG